MARVGSENGFLITCSKWAHETRSRAGKHRDVNRKRQQAEKGSEDRVEVFRELAKSSPQTPEFELSSVSEDLLTKKILRDHQKISDSPESQFTMLKCTHHQCAGCPTCIEDEMEAGVDCMVHSNLIEVAFTASN